VPAIVRGSGGGPRRHGRLTSANLITQGSRLHGSSRLYNHRAQGCEGELGVADVPAEALGVADAPAETLDVADAPAEDFFTITGLMGCEGELVDAALSCGSQLITQRPPARHT
jgi:hypothetical protein